MTAKSMAAVTAYAVTCLRALFISWQGRFHHQQVYFSMVVWTAHACRLCRGAMCKDTPPSCECSGWLQLGLEACRQLRQGCGEIRRNPSKCVEIRRKYPLQITFPKNQVLDPISVCYPLSPVMFGVWLAPRRIWDASGRARRNPSKSVETRRNPSKVSFADHLCRNQ